MRRQDFIDALYKAGWKSDNDARWDGAKKLHAQIFPTVAELEDELEDNDYLIGSLNREIYELKSAT